ncbi:MAG: FecR domain-containing protein [Sphingomonas sp.]|nr:FecR domain-containing protein [Sphingomonas sp.]
MTNKSLGRAAIISVAFSAMLASTSGFAQTVGVNASVINDVRMTTEANPTIHRAAVKERVSLGNDIVTGGGSVLQVLLLDRTSFTVGSNARIKVDRFVYDPSRSASAVGLSVTKGAFRFMSGKSLHANPGQSSIKTPIATIGIRGTIVEGVVGRGALKIVAGEPGFPTNFTADPETASLIMLRGPGANAQGETPGAIDVMVADTTVPITGPGYAVFIPAAGQRPIGPFLMTDRGSALLADLLRRGREETSTQTTPLKRDPLTDLYFMESRPNG